MPQLRKNQFKNKTPPKNSITEITDDPKLSTINIEVRSCFICRKDTSIFSENLFKINTKFSDTPVLKYIDKFLGYTLVKNESFEKLIICKCCIAKIDEFDKAYKTAKLVQNELKELLYVSIQSINEPIPIRTDFVIKTDDDDQPTYVQHQAFPIDVPLEEVSNSEDIKLEIEILDTDENLDEIGEEIYNFDIEDSRIECLDEYHIEEEVVRDDIEEEFFESCLSDVEEAPIKTENYNFGDCITMTCDICNTSFKSLMEMDNHSKAVHGRTNKKVTKVRKPKGDNAISTENSKPFVDHLKLKKSEPTKKCKICLNKFHTVDQVKDHISTIHEFDDQRCEICGIVCAGKIKLQEHMDLHATRFIHRVCCDSKYLRSIKDIFEGKLSHVSVNQKMEVNSRDRKPLECVICSKEVKRRSFLRQHMLIHTGEKVYQCDLCGKQFIHHSSMRMHMRMHRDVRDSECEICGHKSRSKSHLNKHMLTHTGEKKWQCPICLNRFASGGNMRAHMNIHLGIASRKKHICLMCNQLFPTLSKLAAHQQLAHDTAFQGGVAV